MGEVEQMAPQYLVVQRVARATALHESSWRAPLRMGHPKGVRRGFADPERGGLGRTFEPRPFRVNAFADRTSGDPALVGPLATPRLLPSSRTGDPGPSAARSVLHNPQCSSMDK